jgi:hypothetical protein
LDRAIAARPRAGKSNRLDFADGVRPAHNRPALAFLAPTCLDRSMKSRPHFRRLPLMSAAGQVSSLLAHLTWRAAQQHRAGATTARKSLSPLLGGSAQPRLLPMQWNDATSSWLVISL